MRYTLTHDYLCISLVKHYLKCTRKVLPKVSYNTCNCELLLMLYLKENLRCLQLILILLLLTWLLTDHLIEHKPELSVVLQNKNMALIFLDRGNALEFLLVNLLSNSKHIHVCRNITTYTTGNIKREKKYII